MVVCPQPRWNITIHPIGASVLTGTPLCVYPLRGRTRRLAHCLVFGSDTWTRRLTHCLVFGSDTICNPTSTASRYCPLWAFPFELHSRL